MKKQAEIRDLFERFAGMQALVIGDLMLDSYLWGEVERISPESPVPVVDVRGEDHRPGGAGNVALNLRALGAGVSILALLGEDESGSHLQELLDKAGIDTGNLLRSGSRPSTRKTRILGRNQQMIRIDREDRSPIGSKLEEEVLDRLQQAIDKSKPDLILIQDYNKGLLTENVIRGIVEIARKHSIFIAVDPKQKHFFEYRGVDLFKPNLKELNDSMGYRLDGHDQEALASALKTLRERMPHRYSLLTLSSRGMALFDGHSLQYFAAHPRQVADVSGAGDTVIAVAALALASGCDIDRAIGLANLAGGLVCEKVGVVPVDNGKLREEAEKIL